MVDRDILLRVLEAKAARHAEVTLSLQDPAVHSSPERLKVLSRELGQLTPFATMTTKILGHRAAIADAREMLEGDDDEIKELAELEIEQSEEELETLWAGAEDLAADDDELAARDVILEIRSGVGGDEAALFAGDLFTMYRHYCQANRLKLEVIDENAGEMGGYKEIVAEISGDGAYRLLRSESGTHRVQRVPKTESQGRIHTSAATVAVLPKAEALDVNIDWDKDVREDKMRAGGPGGQKVNKTESAIRLVHLETGLTVHIQDEKSQHKNRSQARSVLTARVFDHFHQKAQAARAAERKGMIGSGDRSARIRTYNFPQSRVTDHRYGGHTSHRLEQILLGELGEFTSWFAQAEKALRLENLAREWEDRDRE